MDQFKVAMVGLDLSHLDEVLIAQIKSLAEILDIEKVYFVHVSKNLILPEQVSQAYPDLMAPIDETIKLEISHEIEKVHPPLQVPFEILVKEGNAQDTLLRWSKIKDIDLLVMGRKKVRTLSDSLVNNLTQKYPHPVLLLPEAQKPLHIKNIFIPIDFSDHSRVSIRLALQIVAKTNGRIQCCHLFEVPKGYSKTGKSFEEFSTIMLENAQSDYAGFLKKNDLPELPCTFILKQNKDEADNIMKEAKSNQTDLLIIGSRGRTKSAAILLGSVAEKLVNSNHEIPMLVMKEEGENMSFFEALFKL
ncbi:Nucleotide-binding universal stress protein, UspA family [Cyclobacterium lianum]|uniref:Nucleotide-binding universal stress protein, UspA family n=1 Tax=Cyclobacterium lianum TaxID=388280 RepID=A0A1M7JUC7_9BACT|nr:universal stress protein [Cyclobacterium lianum]SHM56626.1 Nucleotide-binding universal stress protein, UspA family [Cyclobacterium lianum]